ncbi:MAG: KOW motif-containing protein [Bdellovibrionales bacterium]
MASKSLKLKINKGDNVKVIAGSGKGHTGTVLDLNARKLQIKVSGHNMQTHFDKENGIFTKEGFVDYSNVKLEAAPKRTAKKKTAAKKA